jgi:peptidoglycan-associated lipoprotein
MKKNALFLTALALAAVMASTGCKHKPIGVTPIPPGQYGGPVDNQNPNTLGQGQPLANASGPGSTQIAMGQDRPLSDFDQDRDKLAAYTVHFSYDSAVIRDNEKGNLQSVASALQADPNAQLLIEGNCDERGTEEYNRSLGDRRALAAREALAGMGIDASRIRTISYGKDKPADTGHDDTAWTKNRRDDFVVLHLKSGA